MEYMQTLWTYMIASSPYLLFGLFIAGVVKSFLSLEKVQKYLSGSDTKTVLFSSAIGVPLPLCSCSVVPAAVTLRKAGASNGATSSFLISTPESGIDSIAVTYSLMDLPMTIFRPIVAFLSAAIAGVLQNVLNHYIVEDNSKPSSTTSCCGHSHKPRSSQENEEKPLVQKIKEGIVYAYTDLIDDIAFWLVIGLLAGAAIEYFIPANLFEGLSGWSARFVVLAIGLPLYICASASTPVAASLVAKGLSPGAALIFLLVGPATNFSNIAVLQKYIGRRGVIINIIVIALVALLASYLVDEFYVGKVIDWKIQDHLHGSHAWWEVLSAIILSLLLIKGVYVDKVRNWIAK